MSSRQSTNSPPAGKSPPPADRSPPAATEGRSSKSATKSPSVGSPTGQGANAAEQVAAEQIPYDENEELDSALGDGESIASSTASLTSSILDYRNIHGRTFQASKTTEYWGPNDEKQNEGLDVAHQFLTMLLNDRLFEAPVGSPERVLDVGTGTGIWAIDMADDFPSAQVTGTDISPIQPPWVPPNCRFEIDDAQLEWTYAPESFDFVHIRALYGAISDWTALYAQAFRALEPGGWLENLEFTITIRSSVPEIDAQPDHVFKQWSDVFLEALDRIGRTARIATEGNQARQMADVGFVDIVEKSYRVPIGAWSSDQRQKQIGQYNLVFLDSSLEGFALFLLKEVMGWEYAEIQVFLAKMRKEIRDPKTRSYYYITNVYGRKPAS